MKITLELYDTKCTVEDPNEEHTAGELKEMFSKLMVQAGFSPSVIEEEK